MFPTRRPFDVVLTAVALVGVVAALTVAVVAVVHSGGASRTGAVAGAPAPRVQPQKASIVIQHVMRGCHSMVVNGQMPMTANATVHLTPGSTLSVTDDDVMPHRLTQLSGPTAQLSGASMSHMGAQSTVTFPAAGTYSLTTKAGEDYSSGIKTIGEDNTLKIRVVVAS